MLMVAIRYDKTQPPEYSDFKVKKGVRLRGP
jgi:hypothetical protein